MSKMLYYNYFYERTTTRSSSLVITDLFMDYMKTETFSFVELCHANIPHKIFRKGKAS